MGIVYEGRDPNLDRRVAIKTVKVENLSEAAAAEYEARFKTEARSAARLQHPNIVSVYDSDRDGDIAFLVMEFIQGEDLKYHLDRGVRYSLEQSLKFVRDLLSALDYAHSQNIVHRDVKPANLLMEASGRIKLTDFGVARIQDSDEATRTQGSMIGTLKYMSPEQVQGQKIDNRADLFSAGVVLYQLLTDKRPFDGDNDFAIIHQIIGHSPQAPSTYNARLPSAIDAVVARALAKNRDERFLTARDFAMALQSAMRRAEDATVVPPADPLRKPLDDAAATGSRGTAASVTSSSVITQSSSTVTATVAVTQELELVYWKDVKDATDPDELELFLGKFPQGIYADLAQRRLRRLRAGANGDSTLGGGEATRLGLAAVDMEATRLRSDSLPLAAVAAVAAEPVVPEPAQAMVPEPVAAPPLDPVPPSPVPEPVADPMPVAAPVSSPAAPVPPTGPAPSEATARKPIVPLALAGVAAVLVAGALYALVGGSGSAPAPAASTELAASAPQPDASAAQATASAASAVTATAVVSRPSQGASAPSATPRPEAPTTKVTKPEAVVAPPPRTYQPVVPSTPEVPLAGKPLVATAPGASTSASATLAAPAPSGPEAACAGKILLSRETCLREQCALPNLKAHPVCVERREDSARLEAIKRMGN